MAITSPASGPAMPMSSKTLRFRGGAFNRMKAPNVPS